MLAAQPHTDGQVPWCCRLWRACLGGLWLSQAQRIGKRADMPLGQGGGLVGPAPPLGAAQHGRILGRAPAALACR